MIITKKYNKVKHRFAWTRYARPCSRRYVH